MAARPQQILSLPLRTLRLMRRVHADASHMRRLTRNAVFADEAITAIQHRLPRRAEGLLDTIERAIFAHPGSPYRSLMEAAGYDLARIKSLISRHGAEGALRQLCQDGVYVSIEEFKGLKAAHRNGRTFRFEPNAFDNPLVRSGLGASSGGTRSAGISTTISLADHRMGIEHFAAALSAYGLLDRPIALWVGTSHGASLWLVAGLVALRARSAHWFAPPSGRDRSTIMLNAVARLYGVKLPPMSFVPLGQESVILEWCRQHGRGGGCGIFTTPSSALRLALEARRRGLDLGDVSFVTVGEPLTPAKLAGLRQVGARAFSSLGFTEFGRATYGCAFPAFHDDTHICRDAVAVIQRRRAVDQMGTEVDALLFTALWPHARKILLNMETGDYATMVRRECGCPLEALGWTDHLQEIRSFEKLNALGQTFFGSRLYSLVEEVLPAQFGGESTDYQLVEEEDEHGFTRLMVLVHPRLGPINEEAVLARTGDVLGGLDKFIATSWHQHGIVRLRRAPPMLTPAGKLMPLHHLGPPRPSQRPDVY